MVFYTLRQQSHTIQGLLVTSPASAPPEQQKVSKQMVTWGKTINMESIVILEGTIQEPVEPVKSTTVQNREVSIDKVSGIFERRAREVES
jgi:aspartyl-tRNA synthetase